MMVDLEELRGLLLGICQIGIPMTWSSSGKPGWPTDGGRAYGLTGRPNCRRAKAEVLVELHMAELVAH